MSAIPADQRTFWVDSSGLVSPCHILENFALNVLKFHQDRLAQNLQLAGAVGVEWWIQKRSMKSSLGFHWDKDEVRRSRNGDYIFPYLSTITYLSVGGAPTVIMNSCADEHGFPVKQSHSSDHIPITKGWFSYPTLGKHICFDGRFLHGVPAEFALSCADHSQFKERITFMVNIWSTHKPEGIRPFPSLPETRAISAALWPIPRKMTDQGVRRLDASPEWPIASFTLRSAEVSLEVNALPSAELENALLHSVFSATDSDVIASNFGCSVNVLASKSADAITACFPSPKRRRAEALQHDGLQETLLDGSLDKDCAKITVRLRLRISLCLRFPMPLCGFESLDSCSSSEQPQVADQIFEIVYSAGQRNSASLCLRTTALLL